ncbi:MAG: Crp/Fnr family transcriptional regulator [Arenicellales bacterium]
MKRPREEEWHGDPVVHQTVQYEDLPEEYAGRVLALGSRKAFRHAELVIGRGDLDSVYFILDGCMKAVCYSADGHEHVDFLVRPGRFFGLLGVLDGKPRMHDGYAHGHTEVIVIPARQFVAFVESDHGFCRHVLGLMCQRMRHGYQLAQDFASQYPRQRLARKLVNVATGFGRLCGSEVEIELRLSQESLASIVGVSRQTINKELRRMEDEGLIKMHYSQLTICDLAGLSKVAA